MSALAAALSRVAAALRTPQANVGEAARAADLRLLPIRVPDPDWQHQDHGLLLGHDAAAEKWFALPADANKPLDKAQATRLQNELFIPYPRWPPGPTAAGRWLALGRPDRDGNALLPLGAALPACLPAVAALLLSSPRLALVATLVCLAVGGALAGWAVALGRLSRGRDANLRLHGLLWDRLTGIIPGLPRQLPAATLAMRLRDALSAAQREVEAHDRLRESAVTLCLTLVVLTAASPSLALFCGVELLAGFVLLRHLWRIVGKVALARDAHAPALEEALTAAGAVPIFRALRAATWLLGRSGRAITDLLVSNARVSRAVLKTRIGLWTLVLVLLLTIITAAEGGFAGEPSLPHLAAALLAAAAAAGEVYRISAIAGSREARATRMAEGMTILASGGDTPTAAPVPTGRFESLALENVHFACPGGAPILRGIDLTVGRGEIVALSGASGSGRTTLLRIIAGMLEPTAGILRVNQGEAAARLPHDLGAVFQDAEVAPVSIRAAILRGRSLPLESADDAARLVGLEQAISRLPMGMQTLVVPGVLPEGMLQRLLIAQAIAGAPQLLLLDDALAPLDPAARDTLFHELRHRGTTVVFTAHDPDTLASADRMLHLEDGRLSARRGSTPAPPQARTAPPPQA